MTILDQIVLYKKDEVSHAKSKNTEKDLKDFPYFERTCLPLKEALLDPAKNGIIAEYKRASPSKGLINGHSSVEEIAKAYEEAGVSAMSILTDGPSFKGSLEDLRLGRTVVDIPLLRKDFIVDPYQILEAKAWGADVILLIAAILDPHQLNDYAAYAKELGLSVLMEVHTSEELAVNLWEGIDAIGVNNRNLHDFSVSISHSLELVKEIPNHYAKISESGISQASVIHELREAGFHGFLIGENFMKAQDPKIEIQNFVESLKV